MRIKVVDTAANNGTRGTVKPALPSKSLQSRVEKVEPSQNISERSRFNRLHQQYQREQAQPIYREKSVDYQTQQALRGYTQTANFDKRAEFEEIFKVDVLV